MIRMFALLIGCSLATAGLAQDKMTIATDIGALKSIATYVGGSAVTVTRIVPENADHHSLSLRPSQVRALKSADVVLWTDPTFTPAIAKLLTDEDSEQIVLTASKLNGISVYDSRDVTVLSDSHEHDHDHDHDHEDHAIDPHLWLHVGNIRTIAQDLSATLVKRAPEHRSLFQSNLAVFLDQLDQIEADIKSRFQPSDPLRYMAAHDSFQYFDVAYGFQLAAVVTGSDGHEVGPKTVANFIADLSKTPVSCLILDPREGTALAQQIATDLAIPVIELDPTGDAMDTTRNDILGLLRETAVAFDTCFDVNTAAAQSR